MENRRTRYTKEVIEYAFLDLLEQKPLDKITVKELCAEADINHSTFYRYYKDVFDLADKLKERTLREEWESFLDRETLADESKWSESIRRALANIDRHRKWFTIVYSDKTSWPSCVEDVFEKNAEKLGLNGTDDVQTREMKYVLKFSVYACNAVISQWINDGFREEPEVIARFLETCFKKGTGIAVREGLRQS